MQTPANQDDMPRVRRDVLRVGSWYRLEIMHLGSESRDPGFSPDEIRTAGTICAVHSRPAPVPAQRYGAFPELFR
jgi:hypothetical protein